MWFRHESQIRYPAYDPWSREVFARQQLFWGQVDYFLEQLINYDKENIHDNSMKAIKPILADPEFNPDFVRARVKLFGIDCDIFAVCKTQYVLCLADDSDSNSSQSNKVNCRLISRIGRMGSSQEVWKEEICIIARQCVADKQAPRRCILIIYFLVAVSGCRRFMRVGDQHRQVLRNLLWRWTEANRAGQSELRPCSCARKVGWN